MTAYARTKFARRARHANAPAMHKASPARRAELHRLLLVIASRIAKAPSLTALTKELELGVDRTSHWLHWGEIPPWPAADMLKRYDAWRRKELKKGKPIEEITLRQLVPSLFPPE